MTNSNLKTFVFFTKNRPPIRVQAENHLEACEKFYKENPNFHLSELKDIREAQVGKQNKIWLEDRRIVKS